MSEEKTLTNEELLAKLPPRAIKWYRLRQANKKDGRAKQFKGSRKTVKADTTLVKAKKRAASRAQRLSRRKNR